MSWNILWCSKIVKQGRGGLKFGMMANCETGKSILAFIFEIDKVFIKYSQKVTNCHFGVKPRQKNLKLGMMANFSENSNITLIYEIDKVFINYAQEGTHCHFGV